MKKTAFPTLHGMLPLWLSVLKLLKKAPKSLPSISLPEGLNPNILLHCAAAGSLQTDSFRWPPPLSPRKKKKKKKRRKLALVSACVSDPSTESFRVYYGNGYGASSSLLRSASDGGSTEYLTAPSTSELETSSLSPPDFFECRSNSKDEIATAIQEDEDEDTEEEEEEEEEAMHNNSDTQHRFQNNVSGKKHITIYPNPSYELHTDSLSGHQANGKLQRSRNQRAAIPNSVQHTESRLHTFTGLHIPNLASAGDGCQGLRSDSNQVNYAEANLHSQVSKLRIHCEETQFIHPRRFLNPSHGVQSHNTQDEHSSQTEISISTRSFSSSSAQLSMCNTSFRSVDEHSQAQTSLSNPSFFSVEEEHEEEEDDEDDDTEIPISPSFGYNKGTEISISRAGQSKINEDEEISTYTSISEEDADEDEDDDDDVVAQAQASMYNRRFHLPKFDHGEISPNFSSAYGVKAKLSHGYGGNCASNNSIDNPARSPISLPCPFSYTAQNQDASSSPIIMHHDSQVGTWVSPNPSFDRQRQCPTNSPRLSSDTHALPASLSAFRESSEAMTKYSDDPCSDFVSSITEMIVAHNLTSPEDLENLFQCYLQLNHPSHHSTITLAFVSTMISLNIIH